jgi:hypothetical protein
MKRLIGLLALFIICASSAFSQDSDSPNPGDRPFDDAEPIDLQLLQDQINIELGRALEDIGVDIPYDDRAAVAADTMLVHHEYEDSTDADGFLVRFQEKLVEAQGLPCRFVMCPTVSSKTVCPTVRNFDETDTYAGVASRYVAQMIESNTEALQENKFKACGAGVSLTEEYPRTYDVVHTDEPKEPWIHVLFFFVM